MTEKKRHAQNKEGTPFYFQGTLILLQIGQKEPSQGLRRHKNVYTAHFIAVLFSTCL